MPRIYLDSCLVIYLVERHPQFTALLRSRIAATPDAEFTVSALTRLEVLVQPRRSGDDELIARYEAFLARQTRLPLSDAVFDLAIDLRARHGLKTPDALHVAAARFHGCDAFWTNDGRLAKTASSWATNVLAK